MQRVILQVALDLINSHRAFSIANDAVKADINGWYSKVRIGGIIAGHDYSTDWPGIMKAVNEFTNSKRKIGIISR